MTGALPAAGRGGRPLKLTASVRRGIGLILGDDQPSGDQAADELMVAKARGWMRDVMQRSEAGLRPRVRPGRQARAGAGR